MITKILDLLSPQERRRAGLLLGMILVMALLDMVGVASIMPFMAVLANPRVVETNAYLAAEPVGRQPLAALPRRAATPCRRDRPEA
jgi:hypothetical protein